MGTSLSIERQSLGGIFDLSSMELDLVDGGAATDVATHVAAIAFLGAGAAAMMGAEPVAIGLGLVGAAAAIVAGVTA